MASPHRVVAVILAWNNYPDVAECLRSVSGSTYPLDEIVVLDNGSTDGTPAEVEKAFPGVRVVRVVPNAGYASGANRGLAEALVGGTDFVLFLASDTVVAPDMVDRLVTTATKSSRVGIVGPKIMQYDAPETVQHGAGYIDATGYAVGRDRSTTTECEWVTGCGFLIRADALRALAGTKGFDERFFAYWEDVDLSHRIAATGFLVVYEPAARLLHKESPETRANESLTKTRSRTYYLVRNQFLFARRHLSFRQRLFRITRGLAYEMPIALASWIRRRGMNRDAFLVVRAYMDGIRGRDGRAPYKGLY